MSTRANDPEAPGLEAYLTRATPPPAPEVLEAVDAGPIEPAAALALKDAERLVDPAPLAAETGWCWLADGVGYVAVATRMPGVTAEMVDWWFDWHPHAALRYRIWHPQAHEHNSVQEPAVRGAKRHWDTIHHPVEDVGLGRVRARIEFRRPSAMGLSGDHLDDPAVGTIVCGVAGDDRLRVRHTPMFHVFLRDGDGLLLRSRFWLGAALAPYGPLGDLTGRLLNRQALRRRALPGRLPQSLARHCAQEYARLGALLPELYERYAPAS